MDRKRFAKYFAQKPPVVLYVVGGVLLAAGVLIVLIQGGVYNAMSYYIGIPAAVLGLLILGVTRGIVIRDAEADKQLDLLAARADAELPDALRLTAKELETDRVPFKSYIYEIQARHGQTPSFVGDRRGRVPAVQYPLLRAVPHGLARRGAGGRLRVRGGLRRHHRRGVCRCGIRDDAADGADGGRSLQRHRAERRADGRIFQKAEKPRGQNRRLKNTVPAGAPRRRGARRPGEGTVRVFSRAVLCDGGMSV